MRCQPSRPQSAVSQLDSLKQQYDVLEIKLAQKHRLLAKRALIHKEIQKLRTSVPDKPDLDLLIFDLEKMCKTNNTSSKFGICINNYRWRKQLEF